MLKRNGEVHTCDLPFESMSESQWLPNYYEVCSILNEYMQRSLTDYFGPEEAGVAVDLIEAKQSAGRNKVQRRIALHREEFAQKADDEKRMLAEAQKAASVGWSHPASNTECPSCECRALISGRLERTSDPMFKDDALVVINVYLTTSLTCGACGLELRDLAEINLASVQSHYEYAVHTDLHEFYEPDDLDTYMNM